LLSNRLTKVEFTNLNKILYPATMFTKKNVIEYYIRMAPKILDVLSDRLLVTTRYPDGVDREGFYEKDAPIGVPYWVKTFRKYSETARREVNYVVCKDLDTLVWLANLAALELHMALSRTDLLEQPDLVLFDIDPEPPAMFDDAMDVALLLKEKLVSLGLRSYVKTSGKKGLHVVIPVIREYTFKQTREFVHQIGRYMAKESKLIVSEFTNSRDPGTVFVDCLQNSQGRTMICPYSLRATPQATVSTPLEWRDVKKGLKPENLNITTVAKIRKDPWKDLFAHSQSLEANLK
jgi:bifunctional non-homologous end joining protein LigD